MFEIMIGTFYYSFYIGLSGILVLFLMRLYIGIKIKCEIKDFLMLLFLPGSLGLSLRVKDNYPLEKLYFYLHVFFFITMFIGSIFLLYMRLELDLL